MIAEINLLPQRETKQPVRLVLLIGLLLVFAVAALFYWFIERADQRQAALEAELKRIKAEQAVLEAKRQQESEAQERQELAKAVKWAERYPLKSVPLLRALTKQLPERGFVMNVAYAGQTSMTMTVQFDAPEEAAYYLNRLQALPLVQSAKLASVTVSGEQEEQREQQVVPRYIAQYELQLRQAGKEGKR
ncbi:PilN domain-containing protein [Caldibacillus thermoamylovorans]